MTKTVSVRLPKLTMATVEGTFLEWLVADGQHVVEERPIYLVATDKVETEVTASATGVFRHGSVQPDNTYPRRYRARDDRTDRVAGGAWRRDLPVRGSVPMTGGNAP